jgi:hypothetical protein
MIPAPYRRIAALFLLALVVSACTSPVRVEWTTETEMNTAGFNLYRGESPDGPFDVKINDQLIPPADDPLMGKQYTYVDRSALPGTTYYYQLQEVEKDGKINTHPPIRAEVAGFQWWHALILAALAAIVFFLWLRGSKTVR